MAWERDYEVISQLGEGSFGKVYKARHKSSSDVVAVKQIKLGSKSWDEALKSVELQALKALRHPFVVRLRELLRSQRDGSLYYVFEYMESDLCRLSRQYPQGMEEGFAAKLTRQLLTGIGYMHQNNFFHRDMKPENVLYDPTNQLIRIADFGEAKSVRSRPPLTDYVGTRWYRAPECLLRDRSYSSPVDIWAVGLIFAELLRGSPVFSGTSSMDQLFKIFQVLGPPPTDWVEYRQLSDAVRFRAPEKSCGLARVLPNGSGAQGIIADILVLNPRRRPPARWCLQHEYFQQLEPLQLDRLADACRKGPKDNDGDGDDMLEDEASCLAAALQPLQGKGGYPSRAAGGYPVPSASQHPPLAPQILPTVQATVQVEEEKPSQPLGIPAIDDVDLDEELAKILGDTSMDSPASVDGVASRAAIASVAEPSLTNTACGSCAPAFGGNSALPDNNHFPQSVSNAIGGECPPASKELPVAMSRAGSVDALLDSLCAVLDVEEEIQPSSPPSLLAPGGNISTAIPARSLGDSIVLQNRRAETGGDPNRQSQVSSEVVGKLTEPSPAPSRLASEQNWDSESSVEADRDMALPTALGTQPQGTIHSNQRQEVPTSTTSWTPDTTPREHIFGDNIALNPHLVSQSEPFSSSSPWDENERLQLRRVVKRVTRRGTRDKEALWREVAAELGGCRDPKDCKRQYARDYKAHKASQDS